MTKHIGIVGGSPEGASFCYRTICLASAPIMGEYNHPEVSMHTHPLVMYLKHINNRDWEQVGELILSSARKLEAAGADFLICPDNTIHQAFEYVRRKSSLPWIHVAEPVGQEAVRSGLKKVLILGTELLMTGPVYAKMLENKGISYEIPAPEDRKLIDRIIFQELGMGIFSKESREYFNCLIHSMKDEGCDGVILGCAELPILLDPLDIPIQLLDSNRLLAKAAVMEALRV